MNRKVKGRNQQRIIYFSILENTEFMKNLNAAFFHTTIVYSDLSGSNKNQKHYNRRTRMNHYNVFYC